MGAGSGTRWLGTGDRCQFGDEAQRLAKHATKTLDPVQPHSDRVARAGKRNRAATRIAAGYVVIFSMPPLKQKPRRPVGPRGRNLFVLPPCFAGTPHTVTPAFIALLHRARRASLLRFRMPARRRVQSLPTPLLTTPAALSSPTDDPTTPRQRLFMLRQRTSAMIYRTAAANHHDRRKNHGTIRIVPPGSETAVPGAPNSRARSLAAVFIVPSRLMIS